MIKDCSKGKATKKDVVINGKTYIIIISPIKSPKIEFGLISMVDIRKEERKMQKMKEVLEKKIEEKTKTINEQYQQLKQQYEQIQNLQNVKDEFIRNVTHELKTPTSVILMNLNCSRKWPQVGKEKEWYNMIEMLQRNTTDCQNQ